MKRSLRCRELGHRLPLGKQAGFTLIELMSVGLIVSILVMIALPVYFSYSTRAKVGEAVTALGALKNNVVEGHANDGVFPVDNSAAGLGPPDSYATKWVQSINVVNGDIIVTLDVPGVEGETVISHPTYNGTYTWDCSFGTLESRYRPSECR